MQNVAVTDYYWGAANDEIISLDFVVFKKKMLGGVKPNRRFDGWCLSFKLINNLEVDIDNLLLQDGNIQGQPLNPQLAYGVLLAGSDTLKRSGEEEKASILQKASIKFFKKYILKKS